MAVLLLLSVFYIIYGIFGLFGKNFIPDKFKGYEWTKEYIRKNGASYILLGVPWLVLYFAFSQHCPGNGKMIFFVILFSLPSVIYTIYNELKYLKLIKKD